MTRTPDGASLRRLLAATAALAATIDRTAALLEEGNVLLHDSVVPVARAEAAQGREAERAGMVPLAEAARRTGRHREVLRRWCADGRLPAVRMGRSWWLTIETVAMLQAHAGRARPRLLRDLRPTQA